MRMVRFMIGVGILVSVCVLSFNYVRGHQFTAVKEELAEWKVEAEESSKEANTCDRGFRQTCLLLKTAEIENDVCPKSDEVAEKEGEQSDG